MQTLTQELISFMENYNSLHYSNILLKTGFENSKNVIGTQILKKDDGTIIFSG